MHLCIPFLDADAVNDDGGDDDGRDNGVSDDDVTDNGVCDDGVSDAMTFPLEALEVIAEELTLRGNGDDSFTDDSGGGADVRRKVLAAVEGINPAGVRGWGDGDDKDTGFGLVGGRLWGVIYPAAALAAALAARCAAVGFEPVVDMVWGGDDDDMDCTEKGGSRMLYPMMILISGLY